MAGAVALFLMPSGDQEDPMLIRWKHIEKLPWAILLLFGGGLTLAAAVSRAWLGGNLHEVGMLPIAILVLIVATMIIFLTELTSNIATTATFMPVVGAIALEAGYDPIVLLVPVTLAASCAFMLPVATPPNAPENGESRYGPEPDRYRSGFSRGPLFGAEISLKD
jgi:sodium-dependent dicarboxylate transporter 2/3/5